MFSREDFTYGEVNVHLLVIMVPRRTAVTSVSGALVAGAAVHSLLMKP